MAAFADVQRQGFDERIRRIHSGGRNTSGTIYVGPADVDSQPKKEKRRRRKRRERGERSGPSPLSALFMWPFAFLIGALAMLAGRVAAFQLTLRPEMLPPEYASLIMLVADFGIAAVLMIALGWAFHLGGGMRKWFLAAGFVAVMVAEPLIIRQAPDLFVPFFSENYVAASMMQTAPIETVPETLEALSQNQVMLPVLAFQGG